MHKAILLLGTNMGNKDRNLIEATAYIEGSIGTIIKKSSVYSTAPWGFEHENLFFNQAIEVETSMVPGQVLENILVIEHRMGRKRTEGGYAARIIDIDILYFDDWVISTGDLKIPHPLLHERNFTLAPLVEIAPDKIHPLLLKSSLDLLKECKDTSVVKMLASGGAR